MKNNCKCIGHIDRGNYEIANRVYDAHYISPCIPVFGGGGLINITTEFPSDLSDPCVLEQIIRIRKYTPKECWRLMGFDDESFERAAKVVSDAQLYKQAGNSIVVDVLMAIFKEMIE